MTGHARHPWLLIAALAMVVLAPQALLVWPGWSPPGLVENRILAARPRPWQSDGDLARFRREVDAWVADRFPARTTAIVGLNVLRYRLGYSGTPRVRVGRDGWLFFDNGGHLAQLRASSLPQGAVAAWVRELLRREARLRERGASYHVLVPPVKERVYAERLPGWLKVPAGPPDADVLSRAAREAGSSAVLVPLAGLLAAKAAGAGVYTPYDTHWTGAGAYEGYRQLLDAMASCGVDVTARPIASFSAREPEPARRDKDLAHMLGIGRFVDQRFVYLEDPAVQAALSVTYLGESRDWTSDRVIETGRPGPVLLLIGDSFSTALLPLLLPHFSRVVFAHHQNGFHRDDLCDRWNPDAMVLEVIESGIRHAMPANAVRRPSPPLVTPDAAG